MPDAVAVKADRKKLKKEYISGGVSYADLARKYKISESTVKRWAKADGWTEAKAEADAKSEQKMVEAVAQAKAGTAAGVIELSEKLLEKLGIALGMEPDNIEPARLRQYTGALKDLQDIRGDRSKLDLKEQKARITKLQRESQRIKAETARTVQQTEAGSADGQAVTVSIEGEAEAYAD